MAIKKQEFYEGAALHRLARSGQIKSLRYEPPLFVLNEQLLLLLKYSTRGRSPWGFTFVPEEQELMREKGADSELVVGLICGSDGIAAFNYEAYCSIAACRSSALHVSCYRPHGKHYEVWGPDGRLRRKIAPSEWQRVSMRIE